jgi:tRNA(Ile)-lysidine synthase TilS/MesJ
MELQDFASILRGEEIPIVLLKGLREFWGTQKDFWFSHAPIRSWETLTTTYKDDLDTNMHLLLQYDQIYRHPFGNASDQTRISNTKPIAFRFAVALALRMLHNGQYDAAAEWERVFLLLALRHAPQEGLKTLALRKCLAAAEADATPLWCRFLSASVWAIHEWREEKFGYPAEPVVDLNSLHTFSALLESPRTWDLPASSVLHDVMRNSIRGVGARVAVSISGGVDSMVAAWVAAEECKAMGKELILLHISYNNRPECEDECNLVRWFGGRLGVPVYIRRITEIQRIRASGLRAVYEDVTRRIRFAFYRHFSCANGQNIVLPNCKASSDGAAPSLVGCPVILGHNQDDCLENVFRNLSQRIHFDNLFGMSAVGEEQGVVILRPFLAVPKRDILAYADCNGIPHLYDSTPAWSQRGKMRDQLIPGIRSFDEGILGGLLEMVERSRFLEAQWSLGLSKWLSEIGTVLPRDAFLESNRGQAEFWVRVFMHVGFRPSNKSIRNFMAMLDTGCSRVNLNGEWIARISADSIVLSRLM